MRTRHIKLIAAVLGLSCAVSSAARAAILYNPVVTAVGDGNASVANESRMTTIQIFQNTTANQSSPISSLAYNSGATGTRLTNSVSTTSEGMLSNNPGVADAAAAGQSYVGNAYVFSGGYNEPNGTSSVFANATAAPRIVGYMGVNNSVVSGPNYSAASFTTAYSNSNFRAVTGDNTASNYWTAGDSTTGANSGWRYFNTNTQLEATDTSVRTTEVRNGQLFGTTGSGSTRGIYSIGTGTPTAVTTATSFVSGGGSNSPYEFVLIDDPNLSVNTTNSFGYDTAYIADDRAMTSGGGIQKYTWNGSAWALQYTLSDGVGGNRGLAGQLDLSTGHVVLWATTAGRDKLEQVTDTGSGASFITLATAPTNIFYQGVALSPIPEPASLGLAAILLPLLAARRRRA